MNQIIKKEKDCLASLTLKVKSWLSVKLGDPPASTIKFEFLNDFNKEIDIAIENYITPKSRRKSKFQENAYKDYMFELFELYLGKDVLIPYNLEERKKRYPRAFHDLQRYMAIYL
jgi:molecular chaperone HtpG